MHTQGQTIQFIEKIFGDVLLTEQGKNANIKCPFCQTSEKKKLAIRTDNWLCHCWVCGFKSRNLLPVLKKYNASYIAEYMEFAGDSLVLPDNPTEFLATAEQKLTLPKGFIPLAALLDKGRDISLPARKAISYLESRGISRDKFWYFKFGITLEDPAYAGKVIMPSYDKDGELNFFVGRAVDPRRKDRYQNPTFNRLNIVFNEINIDWKKELTIVEGPFDLAKVNENATCLLGKELNPRDKLFRNIIENDTPVALALDQDARKQCVQISQLLVDQQIRVRIVNYPITYKDPGEMGVNVFEEFLRDATLVESSIDLLKEKINSIGIK